MITFNEEEAERQRVEFLAELNTYLEAVIDSKREGGKAVQDWIANLSDQDLRGLEEVALIVSQVEGFVVDEITARLCERRMVEEPSPN